MTRRLVTILALVVVLSLMIVVPVSAKKPAPKLEGQMELSLTVPSDAGPGTVVPGC
jgi:hypothetical protein